MLHINPKTVPFSVSGAYLAVNYLFWDWGITPATPAGWYIRSVGAVSREVFELVPMRHNAALAVEEATATPGLLTLQVEGGSIECAWADTATLLVRARGCDLRLRAITRAWANAQEINRQWLIVPDSQSDKFLCAARRGTLDVDCQWRHRSSHDQVDSLSLILHPDADGVAEIAIGTDEVRPRLPDALPAFEESVDRVAGDFARFLAPFPALAPGCADARDLAAYVLWVSTVGPRGRFASPAVLMSKHWMDSVWSWDHCFTAFGLAHAHPDFAWQQFMLPFHQQHGSGVLPDAINGRGASWVCTKSPIHGWALLRLLGMTDAFTPDHLRQAYEPLSLWARFWQGERALDGDGIPYYLLGNEQFDNTTLSRHNLPYQSADLAGYVVLLQEALAVIAGRIGKPQDADRWRQGAAELMAKIVPHFWRDGQFAAPRFGDGQTAANESLFRYTSLVLGRRLPPALTNKMIADLQTPGKWLTGSGALATEALDSPFYEDDSYVRGPIWAPPNLIIHDGLRAVGENALADRVRDGFCGLCVGHGMSENFNGRTGLPQRDPAYTWTPGAFLAFATSAAA